MNPLKFSTLLVPTIWGGDEIVRLKGMTDAPSCVGESWELSAVEGQETRVTTEGEDAGSTPAMLIEKYGAAFTGRRNLERYGKIFPLLVKFISAADDLSVQVHPNDAMAQRMGKRYGKTEMWYVLDARPEAKICVGFDAEFSPEAYDSSMADGTFLQHLRMHEAQAGDCFFIPAGRIHSIGKGCFLIEIQQTSNDCFRVYDFDRRDAEGNQRELHVKEAREALIYHAEADYRTHYEAKKNAPVMLVDCNEFTVRHLELTETLTVDYASLDSFVIFVAHEGAAMLTDANGHEVALAAGETVVFPAENANVRFKPLTPTFACIEASCGGGNGLIAG